MTKDIQKVIDKGIDFLAKEQEKDGNYLCLASAKIDNYKSCYTIPTVVTANIVLSSLAHLSNTSAISRIKKKVANFLLGERSTYWSLNYWSRKSDWFKKEPFPDDLDDTFCALAALYEYQPELFDGEAMAKIVTMLISAEKQEGGPYDMWLVPPEGRKTWHRTDLVVNSNIAFFLSFQDISLPKVNAFIEKSIDAGNYEMPYNKIYPAIYFISRFYRGKKTEQMISLLLKKQGSDGKWENPLRTALAISSLINLEGLQHRKWLEKGIEYLIKTQSPNGSWEPYSFYFQMRKKEKTLYAGSASITTALCLEAINKFNKISNFQFPISKQIPNYKSSKEGEIYNKVFEDYRQRFSGFSKDFQDKAIAIADKILKKNKDIILLPFYFRNALGAKGAKIEDNFIVQLGLANFFGWIAYTIYDDFLDNEGDPKELPLANVCLRESAEIFSSVLPRENGFADYSKKIFDIIDDANMWEVSHCRDVSIVPNYGDYTQLANKSLGHSLGPMAILFALGYKENSAEARGVMRFFKNYIIARQLNDDAHDWEDDLKRGHVNAVGAKILRRIKNHELRIKDKSFDLEKLREIFWHKAVVGACKDISRHIELAKRDLKKLSVLKDSTVFITMLDSIEQSVEKVLKEREETIKFLKTYKSQ